MDVEAAMDTFRNSHLLRHAHVSSSLCFPPGDFAGSIDCEHCHFAEVSAVCVSLRNHVRWIDCRFDRLDLYATYFLKGLTMHGCVVSNHVNFQSGGHNNGTAVTISDTRFESFVDFEDCWFTGPLSLRNVVFDGGTNLLGNRDTPMAVSFDVAPVLVNVIGDLAMNTYNRDKPVDR